MEQLDGMKTQSSLVDVFRQEFEAVLADSLEHNGFRKTLKSLDKGRKSATRMLTVHEGVVEESAAGMYTASLQTDMGHILLQDSGRTDFESTDPQFVSPITSRFADATSDTDVLTTDELLRQLSSAGANPPCSLLCEVELTRFDPTQREILLPLLWQYILDHRNSNDRNDLVAVGAAIRKYIAIMPMDRMGELAVLLESGHRSSLPIELEIEVAKMIYRNFEVHPPINADPQPELAQRLWEMVQAYTHPRILLRDKHSAAASLAIEAIVSMRSPLAEQAWQAAMECPFRWFAELVSDGLDDLQERWGEKHADAATWLRKLRESVVVHV